MFFLKKIFKKRSNKNVIVNTLDSKNVYLSDEVWQIASNVQIIRERQNITQRDLAERLGYKSASFVSRLELWETEKLTAEQVTNLANALNVQIADILKKKG